MKRSRAALTFFLTTFGLSLIAIGSTCSRSGAADAGPGLSCTTNTANKAAESCSSCPSVRSADFGEWNYDWQPPRDAGYDSLKRHARAAITGLIQLIGETVPTPADNDGEIAHKAAVAQQNLAVEYGCEGYDADLGWYDENDSVAEESNAASIESFRTFAAWRDLSSLAADPRHSKGQADVEHLNADNDGLADETLYPGCGRPWHALPAVTVAAAPSASPNSDHIAEGLDCDYPYCGNDVATAGAAAAGRIEAAEVEWEFGESASSQPTESSPNLRPAMLATARILEQVGSLLRGWGRDLQRAAEQTDAELTAASDRETWGL